MNPELVKIFERSETVHVKDFASRLFDCSELTEENFVSVILRASWVDISYLENNNDTECKTIFHSEPKNALNFFKQCTANQTGCTIFAMGGETFLKPVQNLISQLDYLFYPRKFICGISISNNNSKIPYHSDKADVFIIQIKGERIWTITDMNLLEKSVRHSIMKGQKRLVNESDFQDAQVHIINQLNTGDAMFIPALWPHTAQTIESRDANQITLSISIISEILTPEIFLKRYGLRDKYILADEFDERNNRNIELRSYSDFGIDRRVDKILSDLIKEKIIKSI